MNERNKTKGTTDVPANRNRKKNKNSKPQRCQKNNVQNGQLSRSVAKKVCY